MFFSALLWYCCCALLLPKQKHDDSLSLNKSLAMREFFFLYFCRAEPRNDSIKSHCCLL